jgi:DNA topoisomerase-1
VRVLDGRFGPYVTDGTINATVPRGVEPSSIDLEQAVELLREREARGPAQKRPAKKKAPPAKTTKRVIKKGTSTTSKAGKARAAKKKVAMTTGVASTEQKTVDVIPPPTDEDQPETEADITL